jgi:hypothetical protein
MNPLEPESFSGEIFNSISHNARVKKRLSEP